MNTADEEKLRTFLDIRAERVSQLGQRYLGLTSTFPSRYWPGWCGWHCGKEVYEITRQDIVSPDKIWGYILSTPYCQGGSIPILDRKSLPSFPTLNTDWDAILASLNRVGRPAGEGEFRRPEGPFVFDLVKDPLGIGLLEAAHVVAHARAIVSGEQRTSNLFLETLAELVLALRWGATFHCPTLGEMLGDERSQGDEGFFNRHGIKVVTSTRPRKPWMSMNAVGPNGPRPGRDCIAVLCGIHLEPEPWSTREGNPNTEDKSWLEMNRWSCMPSLVSFDGWKGLDEFYKAPLVLPWRNAGKEDVCLTLPVTALDPPSALDLLIRHLKTLDSDYTNPRHGVWSIATFLKSDWYDRLRKITPPLPCRDCMRLNMASPGAPTRPSCRRPDPSKDRGKKEKWLDEAEREWAAYDAKVDKIFEVVDKACAFYDLRFGGVSLKDRKRRASNARKVKELLGKIERSKTRADKFRKDAEYSKALVEDGKIVSARSALARLMEE